MHTFIGIKVDHKDPHSLVLQDMNRPNGNRQSQRGKGTSQNNRSRNRKRSNNNRRRRSNGPKLTGIDKAYRSYLVLLEKHLEARKKYYNLFHRADPKQLAKLERNFYQALTELRNFEEQLDPEMKEKFLRRVDGLAHDRAYSSNHDLDPAHEVVPDNPDEEPHFLASQKESFSHDTEESKGSMTDYYAYKGIEPPVSEENN